MFLMLCYLVLVLSFRSVSYGFIFFFFFFKQKTAYEMRISDWSSDVCSSDLLTLSPDLQNGAPFAYAVPAGVEPARYRFTLENALTLLQRGEAATPAALARPTRGAVTHLLALPALAGDRKRVV